MVFILNWCTGHSWRLSLDLISITGTVSNNNLCAGSQRFIAVFIRHFISDGESSAFCMNV